MLHIWRHKYISDVAHDIALRILNHLTSILHAYDFRSHIHHRCNLCWVWSHHSICGSAVLTVTTLGLSPHALLGSSQLRKYSWRRRTPYHFPYIINSIPGICLRCEIRSTSTHIPSHDLGWSEELVYRHFPKSVLCVKISSERDGIEPRSHAWKQRKLPQRHTAVGYRYHLPFICHPISMYLNWVHETVNHHH